MSDASSAPSARPRLVADVGGTNLRCALSLGGRLGPVTVLNNDEHRDLAAALRAGLRALAPAQPVREAAIAVAAPVRGDAVRMTNRGWEFSGSTLRAALALDRLEVVNDFTAVALSLPCVGSERLAIGGGTPLPDAALGVLGPGTGLGVSALIPARNGWAAVSGEGGHVTLAASDDFEARLIARARDEHAHVSAERFVSGPGLYTLYRTMAAELGLSELAHSPQEVSAQALSGEPLAQRTLLQFFAFLGTVAADVALTFGTLGGVYLAGGILPALHTALATSAFRTRFEHKGRYGEYLGTIPTWLITAPNPGLRGLQRLLETQARA